MTMESKEYAKYVISKNPEVCKQDVAHPINLSLITLREIISQAFEAGSRYGKEGMSGSEADRENMKILERW